MKKLIWFCFLLFSTLACAFAGNVFTPKAQELPTLTPISSVHPTDTPTVLPFTPSPDTAPGSFTDFRAFASEIDQAIKDKNASFFAECASISEWNCLGDETMGICKGQAAGQSLKGIPVAQDWTTYNVYGREDYQSYWKSTFDQSGGFALTALANQFGDNSFMPMATQSFQATLTAGNSNVAHVLFFEYLNGVWILRGELVTSEHAKEWLDGSCASCYDTWEAWPK